MSSKTVGQAWSDWVREERERRMVAPGLVVSQREAAFLLHATAHYMAVSICPVGPDCDNCNTARATWWDLCNALDQDVRIQLQEKLRRDGCDLPEGPWEDVSL